MVSKSQVDGGNLFHPTILFATRLKTGGGLFGGVFFILPVLILTTAPFLPGSSNPEDA